MHLTRAGVFSILPALLFLSAPLQASEACKLQPLLHQRKDVATIQRLESEWTLAFLRGDTEFVRCLLIPDFTEIMASGQLKVLADELEMISANRGKRLPIPELPKPDVLLHGNVAVAYGVSTSTGADGKIKSRRYADSYIWEDGEWHVFFAQQTRIE